MGAKFAAGLGLSAMLVLYLVFAEQRDAEPPDTALVSFCDGEFVPLPYRDRWPGETMTLAHAKAIGAQPVTDEEIDWSYSSRGWVVERGQRGVSR